jgi:hypothetical protein
LNSLVFLRRHGRYYKSMLQKRKEIIEAIVPPTQGIFSVTGNTLLSSSWSMPRDKIIIKKMIDHITPKHIRYTSKKFTHLRRSFKRGELMLNINEVLCCLLLPKGMAG